MNYLCIVLPAYNEELTISDTIKDYHSVFPDAFICVINNNSADKTFDIATNTISDLGARGKVLNELQQGKGFAVRRALRLIESEFYIMADADMTYPAAEAKKCFSLLVESEVDMVIGDRLTNGDYTKENKRKFHDFGNKMVKNLINFIFKSECKDIFSGLRAFNHKLAKNFPVLSSGFELETELTLSCLRYGFSAKELPIRYIDRPEGSESKLDTFQDGRKVLILIFKILKDYKPLTFFGLFSILNLFISMIFFIVPFLQYLQNASISGVASVVVGSAFLMISILSTICGVILHTIEKNHQFVVHQMINSYFRDYSHRKSD